MSDKTIHILLFTAGVDSYIAYYYLKYAKLIDPVPLYIDIQSRYSKVEIDRVRKILPETVIIEETLNLSTLELEDAFIPNRNALLLAVSSGKYYNYDNIYLYISNTVDDRIGDQSYDFFKSISDSLSKSLNKNVTVISSYWGTTFGKRDIVRWFIMNFPNKKQELLDNTFSCYNPKNGKHCLQCKACFRRNVALQDITILPFYNDDIIQHYLSEIEHGKISGKRAENIKQYIEKLKQRS